jgi:hypothetical protein
MRARIWAWTPETIRSRVWSRLGETLRAQAAAADLDPMRTFPAPPEAAGEPE